MYFEKGRWKDSAIMPTTRVDSGSDLELQAIADALGKSRKVVVVTGAGISTNCGIPVSLFTRHNPYHTDENPGLPLGKWIVLINSSTIRRSS